MTPLQVKPSFLTGLFLVGVPESACSRGSPRVRPRGAVPSPAARPTTGSRKQHPGAAHAGYGAGGRLRLPETGTLHGHEETAGPGNKKGKRCSEDVSRPAAGRLRAKGPGVVLMLLLLRVQDEREPGDHPIARLHQEGEGHSRLGLFGFPANRRRTTRRQVAGEEAWEGIQGKRFRSVVLPGTAQTGRDPWGQDPPDPRPSHRPRRVEGPATVTIESGARRRGMIGSRENRSRTKMRRCAPASAEVMWSTGCGRHSYRSGGTSWAFGGS